MTLITCQDWTEAEDGIQFAPTNDPRVVAVIQRDNEGANISELYDGDAINPIIYVESSWYRTDFEWVAGYKGSEAETIKRANEEWDWPTARRYLWIFHGIAAEDVGDEQTGKYIVVTSNEYLKHIGATDLPATYEEAREDCKAIAEDLQTALDGDVYGIGYAVNEARVLDDAPIDLEDGNWTVETHVWGFVGEEYAKQEASAFGFEEPNLPEMLAIA